MENSRVLTKNLVSKRPSPYFLAWLAAATVYLTYFILRILKHPGIMGEEIAILYRDPIFFQFRLVSDGYATTYSIHLFHFLLNKLIPLDLVTPRTVVTLLSTLNAPISLALYRAVKQDASRLSQTLFVAFIVLCPTIAWFASMNTEISTGMTLVLVLIWFPYQYPLFESISGKMHNKRALLFVFLAAFASHWYGGIVTGLLVGWSLVLFQFARPSSSVNYTERLSLFGFFFCVFVFLSSWPFLYFKTPWIGALRGGGSSLITSWETLKEPLGVVYEDLFTRGSSYLLTGFIPRGAFDLNYGGKFIIGLALLGIWSQKSRWFTWVLVGTLLFCLFLSIFIAPTPGIRRGLFGLVIIFLFSAIGFQWITDLLKRVHPKLAAVLSVILFILVLKGPIASTYSTLIWLKDDYVAWLARDFPARGSTSYAAHIRVLINTLKETSLILPPTEYDLDYALLIKSICEAEAKKGCHAVFLNRPVDQPIRDYLGMSIHE